MRVYLEKIYQYLAILTLMHISNFVHLSRQQENQVDLNKTSANQRQDEIGANIQRDIYKAPFIVLMSIDTISVAQLPLIENGNLTVVYRLVGGREIEHSDEDDGDENRFEEDSKDDEDVGQRNANESGADVRELEQMPHGPISTRLTATTTSLGKSEWQQIAIGGGHSREEVWPQMSQTTTAGRKEEEAQDEEDRKPRKRRRARRSNSILNSTDGDGNNRGSTNASNDTNSIGSNTNQQQQPERYSNQDVQTEQKANIITAEESSFSNVTSAQFETRTEQPNLAAMEGKGEASAEGADKSSQTQSASPEGPASSPRVSTIAEFYFNGGAQFCDFDVHMSLGYAFVADSTGRIHRFRLLNSGSSSSAAAATKSQALFSSRTHSVGPTREAVGHDLAENDYTNTIDAVGKFESSPRQSKTGTKKNYPSTIEATSGNSVRSDETEDEASSLSAANKVSKRDEDVTHEQSADERQHPAISGEQQTLATAGSIAAPSGAPISGNSPASLSHYQNNNQADYAKVAETRIIWSRSKNGPPLLAARATAPTEKPSKGALPLDDGSQVANRTNTHLGGTSAAVESQSQQQASRRPAGRSSESQKELLVDSLGGTSDDLTRQPNRKVGNNKRHNLRTEIAVDWLNNLLFVLDKYRLLVVDFDGNNELVLIDDFNPNNRPIDIKVDPINDFLFWLQVGKFHNTIYKLDLSVLSLPSATQRLVGNTLKLRQIGRTSGKNNSNEDSGVSLSTSDLTALVSHHYAHPIITNLPRHTKLFTIDHKHSRIYVPLGPAPSSSFGASGGSNSNIDPNNQTRDETEVFASSDNVTHLNTELNLFDEGDKNCTTVKGFSSEGNQILAYNLDGTDVGPLRSAGEESHISSLDDMQDITVDSEKGLLYWLTNDGKELFEEYKDGASIYPAQHNLGGKSYSKLMHFDNDGSNQPTNQKPRFNMRKIIHMLSSSISPNRWTRDSYERSEGRIAASSLNGRHRVYLDADSTRFSRNAPFIILGITGLIVLTVYLIYALIFQQTNNVSSSIGNNQCHNGSIGGSSTSRSHEGTDINTNTFLNTNTISQWIARPSARSMDTSTFNRDLSSTIGQAESCDIESTNYNASNAIDEHYRDTIVNHQHDTDFLDLSTTETQLANLSEWPSNMHDLSNKLYVPVEVLQDEALSSIHRVSIDQLEIERKAPLGEGHFGTVLQGTIKCTLHKKSHLLNKSQNCYEPISPTSLAPPSHQRPRLPFSSTTSSGHGSSSSTSCEFTTANSCTDATTMTNNGDYLTPKSQCNSAISDYAAGNQMPSEAESYSSYGDASVSKPHQGKAKVETKLRVAIKRLKDNASSEEKRDFLQEAKLLANFDHPNVVHLIGICLDRGSTLIVMELMLGGDLIRYMQENTPSFSHQADNLTYDDLLKICLDIVNGCCYLEELDYIHRDLAARNCLVSSRKREERVVKLADFGLARDIYKDSYYKKLNDSAMPLKWMAPECLIEQKFTKKSDVWSFGVVMWEVMSYCQEKPYGSVEPFFMKEHLASGARLRKPDNCDDDMYKLMNQCWQMEPENRPTFHECRAILIEIRNGR